MKAHLNGHIDSFYASQNTGISAYSTLTSDLNAQICVVGGGLAGLSCARELAENGFDVVLLEAKRIGWGASGRNGGFVSDGFAQGMGDVLARVGLETAQGLFSASVEGVEIVRDNIQLAGRGDVIQGHGGLKLVRTPNDTALRKQLEDYKSLFKAERVFIPGNKLEKYINSNSYQSALYNKNAFHIDPLRYSEILAQQAVECGAVLFEQSEVQTIRSLNGRWDVNCSGGRVEADHVIIATSGYGAVFEPIARAMVPVATYVVASKPLGAALDGVIDFQGTMADTRRAGDYFRTVGEGDARRLIWGGRITTRRSQPKQLANMLAKDIAGVFPQLSNIEVEHAWSGLMGYTRHKMPLVGQFWRKEHPNLWACTGFGGHGLNTTAVGGRIIAEAIARTSDRVELFRDYRPVWTGGPIGRITAQLSYWNMQRLDKKSER
jgi:glycine/D-amino acid oxidase-like deaminating enzyme